MILVRIARIIHAIICVAAFMVFVNHGSAQESDPSETVQTDVPSTPADLSRSTGSDCAAPVEGSQAIVFAPLQTSEFARSFGTVKPRKQFTNGKTISLQLLSSGVGVKLVPTKAEPTVNPPREKILELLA